MSQEKDLSRTLVIETDYPDFFSFYAENKRSIYLSIIDSFDALAKADDNIQSLAMRVDATVDGMEWSTDFTFNRHDYAVLTRDLLPFFVENEEYEVCGFIVKLHEQLRGST